MTDSPSPPSASTGEDRLARTARVIASLAERLATGVAALAGMSAGAGALLWGLLWWPPSAHVVSLLAAMATLVLLLSPAVTLGLFYVGLRDLLALPDRLSNQTARTVEQSADAVRSVTAETPSVPDRLWGIVKQIWALRIVLLENRVLLLRYGALLRFVNPGFLLFVVGATIATGLLVPGTMFALTVAWIF